ncbi:cell division protein ZipA C-terminal FtsZ-binding domain-containing protein [Vogesella sp. DC21W]|uniref:Cell division protein ZipA n=1 Tax=Vogesella aquatica TaxID=2984206 RepID=A0ABT5IWA1_9NEIS|nr:cell division protein ZipA C-terminal FtsZ-binding domain-containing protein [Vogesella aquatica]MDC7716829.1 cell division protein ZipA C-terminal FtsZ-binding domain-containing protein [Vogesella aquatica]
MSEMKIGILLLSALVVALVFGFNFYQEWRFRKKTSQAFARHHTDVLLDVPRNNVRDGQQARLEPVLLDDEDDSTPAYLNDIPPPAPLARTAQPEPVAPLVQEPPELDAADHQALVVSLLDPSLDFIAEVAFAQPQVLEQLPRFNVAKRVQAILRTERGLWKPAEILPGTRYKQVNFGLQLVDRGGAVTEQELASFCQQVSHYAEKLGAQVSFPQRQQKLVSARELDRFCVDVDVLIGINIVAGKPIAGARLRSVAEAAGLQLEPDGQFHYLADSGNTLFSLASADQTPFTLHTLLDKQFPALTLMFDVPRVAGGVAVFDRAVQFAKHLSQEFDAQLVDDNRRVLSDQGLAQIRDQLTRIYGNMDDRGIAPGSVAALRLFA